MKSHLNNINNKSLPFDIIDPLTFPPTVCTYTISTAHYYITVPPELIISRKSIGFVIGHAPLRTLIN